MKSFLTHLLFLFTLLVPGLADPKAIGKELQLAFEIYKLENKAHARDSSFLTTVAIDCTHEYKRVCFFDEFIKSVIGDEWNDYYKPTPDDHTMTPGDDSIKRVTRLMPEPARFSIKSLLP